MTDLRQTPEWGKWMEQVGWKTDKIKSVEGKKKFLTLIKKIPLLPISILKLQRFDTAIDFESLKAIKNKYKILFTIIEPLNKGTGEQLIKNGFHLSKSPYLPTKTLIIDLTKNEKNLFYDLSDNAKRILKKQNSIVVKRIERDIFYQGWKKWAKSLILTRHQFDKLNLAFNERVEYWGSFQDSEIASAIMMIYSSDGAHYYQTWTSEPGRKNNGQYYLVWETIKDAKRRGKKYYDFEGIQDKRFPLQRWEGFTEFKKKFGGQELEYPGCYTKLF